jgi:L-threonylcarbamoyladenylate synthase
MKGEQDNFMIHKDTLIIKNPLKNKSGMDRAAEIIQSGGLVVFPTETVYGLGADALNAGAVRSIFTAKGRPSDNPLIVHIDKLDRLDTIAADVPEEAYRLFGSFSPGPLTIILPKRPALPSIVTAGLETVAVRIPSHPAALKLLELSGMPIAAPSANRSGRPSPTGFEMALAEMAGRADAVIDGGDCDIGLESTVVRLAGYNIEILRPGSITEEMIKDALKGFKNIRIIQGSHENQAVPSSPGMKYAHYKPKAEVYLSEDMDFSKIKKMFPEQKTGILCLNNNGIPDDAAVKKFKSLSEYAKNLYRSFAEFDAMGVTVIIAQAVPEKGIGVAIMNRLNKASGGRRI